MSFGNLPLHAGPICLQLLIAALVLLVIALAPPAQGAILLVSLRGETAGEIARWAVANDARLLQRGPWPNSLVVIGSRAALLSAAVEHRGLMISGLAVGCRSTT